ncbi:MAG: UDP-N-acetylmuramoyl-L-alanyl-D-glutamate--2,6-diaminopimelate ligase [Ilumatobacteraceae bacterium]
MARHSCPSQSIASVVAQLDSSVEVVNGNIRITGMTQDSRDIQQGDLYCCIRGDNHDGHAYVPQAIQSGAVALLVDQDVSDIPAHISVMRVADVRQFVGPFAAAIFGFPAQSLTMVGVTGTNGKTTTTAMLVSIFDHSGQQVRQIGTLTGVRTTPEAIDIQAQLRQWVDDGVQCVVMEVSSHALAQHRVGGVKFDAAVFTNISRDHLDFHGTDEVYFAAKAQLFSAELSTCGIVNVDDPKGLLLHDAMSIPMVGFSASDAHDVSIGVDRVTYSWRGNDIEVPLGGSFTVMNSLAAATTAAHLGIGSDAIVSGLRDMIAVPGRFESVPNERGIGIIVDYAHTPDSLSLLLHSVRQICSGRVIVVFGCGGNRDAGKRPLMGHIAGQLADVVVVTSDNPRFEQPEGIIDEICRGISESAATVIRIADRAIAIESAISEARRDDIVVIAGKGHETAQEVSGDFHPFNDVDVVQKFLNLRKETTE